MAVTGTETEQDPYIVTTIGEVLEKMCRDECICLSCK